MTEKLFTETISTKPTNQHLYDCYLAFHWRFDLAVKQEFSVDNVTDIIYVICIIIPVVDFYSVKCMALLHALDVTSFADKYN